MANLYTILGVKPSATDSDIKRAYRTKAKRYHPDVAGDSPESVRKFEQISNAYEILGDKQKRSAYDRGEIGDDGKPAGFGDIFDDLLKRAGGQSSKSHHSTGGGGRGNGGRSGGFSGHTGDDVSYTVTVDFESACRGASRRIRLQDNRPLEVKIPAGIKDGQTLRLKGKGKPSQFGGQNGDALVEVKIAPHPHYARTNNDIYMTVPITLSEAILGAKINVPTLHGSVAVTIPKNSTTNTKLRIKGKGIHPQKGNKGDHYITLSLTLPNEPDPELEKFISKWKNPHNPRKGMF